MKQAHAVSLTMTWHLLLWCERPMMLLALHGHMLPILLSRLCGACMPVRDTQSLRMCLLSKTSNFRVPEQRGLDRGPVTIAVNNECTQVMTTAVNNESTQVVNTIQTRGVHCSRERMRPAGRQRSVASSVMPCVL